MHSSPRLLLIACLISAAALLGGFVFAQQASLPAPLDAARKPIRRVDHKFDFGPGQVAAGYQQVLPTMGYSRERGYGFEPGASVTCTERKGGDALRSDFCTSEKPLFFSVALPEGNYLVNLVMGDADGATSITIKAELRRLMVEEARTERGAFTTRAFTVNVRTPQIAGGGEVKLKDREKTMEWWAWDEKLTLEFNGARPTINALEITRVEDAPTVYLLGDSTVCDQPREPYNSWGQMLPRFFKQNVAVANHAESGESLKSSLSAGRVDKVMSLLRPGDYLFLQYGHNDQKDKAETALADYTADLKRLVAETRKRGGLPVLLTSVNRRNFNDEGKVMSTLGAYPDAVRQVSAELRVPLIDLNALSKTLYEALGPQGSGVLFKEGDGTHHSNYGSYELAKCVVEGIRANRLDLVKHLANDTPTFDPSKPDPFAQFKIPASPLATETKPLGN